MNQAEPTRREATPRQPIPILYYSTSDIPASKRYRAWSLRDWPRTEPVFRTEPFEPFDTSWESAQLGSLVFIYTEITGMRWERRIQDIRVSDFDPLILNLMIEGTAQGDMDGRAFLQTRGTFHIQDLARPSLHVSTASRTYSLLIPRGVASEALPPLHDLHGLVVRGEPAAMMFAHAAYVRRALHHLDLAHTERIGRVFLDLLALALAEARPEGQERWGAEKALRRRAAEEIEKRLGGGAVSVKDVCRVLGVTRGRLFAAFQPDGGVQAYIMTERLGRARVALADIDRAEPIGAIAHRLGFSDAPHLSRAFRQRYGLTPREYRQLIDKDRELLRASREAE